VKAQSGKRPTGQTSIARQIYQVGPAFGQRKSGRRSWKRCEPLPVPGCNKPGTHSRRKPSGWCKTTRAERVFRIGIRSTDGGGNATRSGREGGTSEKGTPSSESHERQVHTERATARQSTSDRIRRSEGEAKVMRDSPQTVLTNRIGGLAHGKTLRINPATGQGREGSSEGQRAATARDGRYRPGNGHGPAVP
jgi:hypothetical protein